MPQPSPFESRRAAGSRLEHAFEARDRNQPAASLPRIGIFGNGFPETLVAAAGGVPVHLSMGQLSEKTAIDEIIEPFVDEEVRIFLNRLMNGEFADFLGIVFARDDAPALVAYQYACEWVRQGRAPAAVPPMFLWNLVHATTPAVERFNAIQAEKLFDFLNRIGLNRPDDQAIAEAAAAEGRRRKALERLGASGVSGTVAMRWRNAGRFMTAGEHADLLDAALGEIEGGARGGLRIGVIGSPLLSPASYELFEGFGTIVCDWQPWGAVWPGPGNDKLTLPEILRATAADPSCPRIAPTTAFRTALLDAVTEARCELVLCQLAPTDDTIGWEIPAIASALGERGIAFVNLGVREPDQDTWHERAAALISAKLEARK